MTVLKKQTQTCPSSVCEEGGQMLGIVNGEGKVSILSTPLPIDKEFMQMARQTPDIEQRFRFTGTCIEKGCKQWTGNSCGVIERTLKSLAGEIQHSGLPKCSIRKGCKWFLQEGKNACKVCPLIITDSTS